MYWLDPIGAVFSLSSTFLFSRALRCAWLVGLVAIIFNIILYTQKGIYARLFLEGFYLVSMISGFYLWGQNQSKQKRPITSLTVKQCALLAALSLSLIACFYYFLITFTDSTIPLLDAASTVGSLCAQCLLCYKIIQCWMIWLIVDILVAYLQFEKEIPFHASIHLAYVGLAIYGYVKWQKTLD